jgi:hypothetical protein
MFFQLKITLRNLWRGRIYSAINIGGLAIGMAATVIIMLWVYHQCWVYVFRNCVAHSWFSGNQIGNG